MVYLFILLVMMLLLMIVAAVVVFHRRQEAKHRYASLSERVHSTKSKFSFLIDQDFQVKETNFYDLNTHLKDDQPHVLGNVLRCQSGCDAGLCGTGMTCNTCPIRIVIRNSFKQKRDFSGLSAVMNLYGDNYEVQAINVRLDGKHVLIGKEPHFVVNVTPQ